MRTHYIHWPLLALTLAAIAALCGAGAYLAHIDTDITRYLPQKDPVIADAGDIFKYHPLQGEMVVDLAVQAPAPDRLVACGRWIAGRMNASGLFTRVGMENMQALFPELLRHITATLPVLFSKEELQAQVLPLLADAPIKQRLAALQAELLGLDAIGQSQFIARDPLALRNLIMGKMAYLAPSSNIDIYQGQLLSPDHRHLLIVASPAGAGTDTAFAARLNTFMQNLTAEATALYGAPQAVTLTPMGAYRAALDNERIARQDVQKAIVFSTIGIALLLLLAFPRPLIGLFAFLPAAAGTAAAFFVLVLLHKNVSIMALGFGGAIISITVDHGIAYLLFLDRSHTTTGKAASREIWAIGLLAALTTIGAFSALFLTGFPILAQLGQFAALGIAFSFLFVHFVFPVIFPQMPPARPRALPLRRWVAKIPVAGKYAALGAALFAGTMFYFADPQFNADLSSMNTMSRETAAAEAVIRQVWGDGLLNKVYTLTTAETPAGLQAKGDILLEKMAADIRKGRLQGGFLPSMVFPGETRRLQNFAAWKDFWTTQRITALKQSLAQAEDLGFAADAFAPFLAAVVDRTAPPDQGPLPELFAPLMGIVQHEGTWMQFATLTPGPQYQAAEFRARYGAEAKIFDPNFFSQKLGALLFATFMKMLIVITAGISLLLFFFFLDLKLTAIALSPMAFALAGTLGTLHLIGHPLDIPALMLGIVILGMGIDYTLFFIRAYQHYGAISDPGFERIKLAVIMAFASTLIGFGVLATADHALLHSAGVTSALGISYAMLGAFLLLPFLLTHHFRPRPNNSADARQRILHRYKNLEVYPRLFARFKMKTDIMFAELPSILPPAADLQTVLDIGCGYGVPGCWVLEHFPRARVYAIDPLEERIRVAALAFGARGKVTRDLAPHVPQAPNKADAAFLLDIIHFLDDDNLRLTLQRLGAALNTEAALIVRAVVPPAGGRRSMLWKWDALKMKLNGYPAFHRSADRLLAIFREEGFDIRKTEPSGSNQELLWIVAAPRAAQAGKKAANPKTQ